MRVFMLAKLNETQPVGKTSVYAVLRSPYDDVTTTSYALMKYLRENNIQFSVRQHRTRRNAELAFNFGADDYTVRYPFGSWEYIIIHKEWFGIPEWTLPKVDKEEQGGVL